MIAFDNWLTNGSLMMSSDFAGAKIVANVELK